MMISIENGKIEMKFSILTPKSNLMINQKQQKIHQHIFFITNKKIFSACANQNVPNYSIANA